MPPPGRGTTDTGHQVLIGLRRVDGGAAAGGPRAGAKVPAGAPGRGITDTRRQVLIGLRRVGGGAGADDLATGADLARPVSGSDRSERG